MTDANEEEEQARVDAEAAKRDGGVPPLPSYAVGLRAMARTGRDGLQGRGGLAEQAYETGYTDGYGAGFVDGHDEGWDAAVCVMRKAVAYLDWKYPEEDNFYNALFLVERALEAVSKGEFDV
jgi:hypothetical protein